MPDLPPTIRVHAYWGDWDDHGMLIVLGPYPDQVTRDREMRRLREMPSTDAEFEPSTIQPEQAMHSATAEQVAAVRDGDGLVDAIFASSGDVSGCDTEDVHPDQMVLFR